MNENAYLAALKNLLMEIRNVCSDVRYSFVFTKEGSVVAGDPPALGPVLGQKIEKAVGSFRSVLEKVTSFGGVDSLLIDGSDGKLLVSSVEGMYLGIVTSENVDMRYLHSIVHSPCYSPKGFFAEEVQIDGEILERWPDVFKGGKIVEVMVMGEKMTLCRVKGVRDPELRGKRIIKMPNKIRKALKVEKGDFVKVTPVFKEATPYLSLATIEKFASFCMIDVSD